MRSHQIKSCVFDGINFAIVFGILFAAVNPPSEQQALDLPLLFTVFLALFTAGALISVGLNARNYKTLGQHIFAPNHILAHEEQRPQLRTFWGWQLWISMLTVFWAGAQQTNLDLMELLDRDGFKAAKNLFQGLLSPDLNLLPMAVVKVIETIFIALIATLLAIPVAFVLAFFSAKNLMTGPFAFILYATIRTSLNIIRSVEPIIWAIIFAVWVGVGPFAGMLALMIQSIASLTKQYSEFIEGVDQGPVESIVSTGANKIQTVWYGIVPQVLLPYVSFTIYRWDTNVRMATIIGFAGGGGIGTLLYQYSMRAQWAQVSCLIAVIAAVVWILDVSSAYLREALK